MQIVALIPKGTIFFFGGGAGGVGVRVGQSERLANGRRPYKITASESASTLTHTHRQT